MVVRRITKYNAIARKWYGRASGNEHIIKTYPDGSNSCRGRPLLIPCRNRCATSHLFLNMHPVLAVVAVVTVVAVTVAIVVVLSGR